MGETVRRKKKGRPSKADLARRNATSGGTHEDAALEPEGDVRRSLRRRNVKYIFDVDDYVDDDDEFEDEKRREKKLKLLLSLHSSSKDGDAAESTPGRTRRVSHSPTVSGSSSDQGHGKQGNNRKVVRDNEIDGSDGEENGNEIEDDEDEVGGNREEHIGEDSAPGTQIDPPCGHPLPEKKTLELILEKLQKKDIYGVYAEPVDPEELPDYHDVIEHPMDFATVRKKLTNGTYLTLEQFKSDVFQICINAMQYNAPDTIYHKQAYSIQELAKKKFEKLRIDIERSDKEIKSEQKIRFHSLVKKQIRKPMSRMVQEPVGSDFSSGATLATTGDFQNGSNAIQAGGLEKPNGIDVFVEGNSSLIDNNVDKMEELQQGKSLLSRFGKKPYVHDENRRATYNISSQPATCEETLFTMFEGESKHLVTVGLYADHAYARSLAHFAATLGPVAWSVASKRIEQALPAGFKFGRGWVGEYEPLPTPVLMPEKCMLKDPISLTKFEHVVDARNDNETCRRDISAEHPENGPSLEGVPPLSSSTSMKRARAPGICVPFAAKQQTSEEASLERRSPFLCSGFRASKASAVVGANIQQQGSLCKNFVESEKRVLKQVELNHPPSVNQRSLTSVSDGHISNGSELSASGSREMVFGNKNSLPSAVVASKQSNTNGIVSEELPNVKALSNSSSNNGMVNSSSIGLSNQMVGAPMHFPHELDQPVGDPVQLMKMLAEKAQNQQKSSNAFPVDALPVSQSVLYPRDDPTNAAAAAARAWMSIGAVGSKPAMENTNANKNQISVDSLYNPARGFQPQISRFRGEFPVTGMHLLHEKNSHQMNAFASQYDRMGNASQIQNQHLVFPQLSPADLSRFQVQSPRRGPQMQPQQQPESRPPDLNISFQSSGSPARQSSGILVDSQQPDLALQL